VRRDRERTYGYFQSKFRIEVDPSLMARHPKVLDLVPSPDGKEVKILFSNSTRKEVFEFLISKKILQLDLREEEEWILLILSSNSEIFFSTLKELKRINFESWKKHWTFPLIQKESWRRLRGSKISFYAHCEERRNKVKQPNRIGVGYKDKGTLGTGLSWRDQILVLEEELGNPVSFSSLVLSSLGMISNWK